MEEIAWNPPHAFWGLDPVVMLRNTRQEDHGLLSEPEPHPTWPWRRHRQAKVAFLNEGLQLVEGLGVETCQPSRFLVQTLSPFHQETDDAGVGAEDRGSPGAKNDVVRWGYQR